MQRLLGAWAAAPEQDARAAPQPEPTEPEPAAALPLDGRLLRCKIGAGAYAFALLAVAEVVPYSVPRRLPGQPPGTGLTTLRGRTLPTIDAATRMGIADAGTPMRMVVVATSAGEHAVAVTDAHDIVEIGRDRLRPPPPGASASAFVAALADIDGEVVVGSIRSGCAAGDTTTPHEHARAMTST